MGDFNWHGDENAEDIVLNYQPPTAVYQTKGGGVCIRQKADETEEYDPQIILTPQGALAVAWRMIEAAHAVGLPAPSLSLMAESENWPPPEARPRRRRRSRNAAPVLAPAPVQGELRAAE